MNESYVQNIFSNLPEVFGNEVVEDIINGSNIKIERIISHDCPSPEGFWYDQEMNEWVILLKGRAGIVFENNDDVIELKEGDYLFIPAYKKHRVEWTDKDEKTVWLAIYFE